MILQYRLLFVALLTGILSLVVYQFIPEPYGAISLLIALIGGIKFRGMLEEEE